MRLVTILSLGLIMSACSVEQSGPPSTPKSPSLTPVESEFSEALERYFRSKEAAGFSGVVLLSHGDKVLLRQPYGVSGCTGRAIQTTDIFDLGSIVKAYTKLAVYHLVADGKLKLGDPISAYFPHVSKDKTAITVGMLVAHSSGLDDIVGEGGQSVQYSTDWDYLPVTRDQIISHAMQSTLIHPPGEAKEYSNLGYSLLAGIIENASGTSFESYLEKKVFKPFGMSDTGYVLPDWDRTRLVNGCDDGDVLVNPVSAGRFMTDGPGWNLRGNGGMMGSAEDIFRWISALHKQDFLPEPVMAEFFEAATGQSRTFEETAAAFAGGNGVFNAYYIWLAETDFRFVLLSNNSAQQGEDYLDELFPLLKAFKADLRAE